MSRARGRKQQETRDFFAENPEAFDFDTQLSVVNNGGRFEVQAEGSKGKIKINQWKQLLQVPVPTKFQH